MSSPRYTSNGRGGGVYKDGPGDPMTVVRRSDAIDDSRNKGKEP